MKTNHKHPTHPRLRGRGGVPTFERYLRAEWKRRARRYDEDGAPLSVASFVERSLEAYE